jgi:AAA15 family ATPase/GTPase
VDIRLERNESNDGYSRTQYFLQHVVSTVEDNAWLPLDEESHGTQTMFRIALPILSALDTGSVLLVDELESSLHPLLAIQIVKLFNNPATNPKNAQLIFTTHDSNLLGTTLGPSVLRRDQVFLTEKSDEGASVVYPLTDYKPRKSENLERGYLQGRYGAIPFLGGFAEFEEEN